MSTRISLSPSGAKCWLSCTKQPIFVARNKHLIPPEEPHDYTTEGIRAHNLAAEWLLLGKPRADDFGGDIEMMRYVASYTTWIASIRPHGAEQLVETKCDLFYMPGRHGFIDCSHITSTTIQVIDLKYGAGVAVNAFQNPQLAIYARSLVESSDWKKHFNPKTKVEIYIFQPRVFRGEKISKWSITLQELVAFTDEIAGTAKLIQAAHEDPDNEEDYGLRFFPDDDVCRFCPASTICKANDEYMLGDLGFLDALASGEEIELEEDSEAFLLGDSTREEAPAPNVLRSPELMDPAILAKVLRKKAKLTKWLGKLEDYAYNSLMAGQRNNAPGFKLVEGAPGARYWNDEKEAERLLRQKLSQEEREKRKLISPAQAEEALKGRDLTDRWKAKLEAVTSKKSPSMQLATEDDDRPEALPTVQAELEFKDLDALEREEDILSDMLA